MPLSTPTPLPTPSAPGANYVPFVPAGGLVFLTGQLSQWNGERRFVGKLGREWSVDEGRQAARLRGRIERILARATVEGLRTGANPATWRGHLQEALPPRSEVQPVKHFRALEFRDIPACAA